MDENTVRFVLTATMCFATAWGLKIVDRKRTNCLKYKSKDSKLKGRIILLH